MGQEKFSQLLRRRRRELGLSQEDLADTAGLSANYIAKLETDHREPGLKAVKLLSQALNLTVDEILSTIVNTWPETTAVEPSTEFLEFPEVLQDLLVEMGFLLQKYCKFKS